MTALGAARLMLGCAVLAVASAALAAFYDVLLAFTLGALAILLTGTGWLALEAYRSMQEWHHAMRRRIWEEGL